MTRLNNALVLVTGAGSGIGRATAIAAAARGGRMILTDLDDDALQGTVADIRAAGHEVAFSARCDLTEADEVTDLAIAARARVGRIDIVINVAGVSAWGPINEFPAAEWERLISVNLLGPVNVLRDTVPAMIDNGLGGHLVNVSSAAGLFGLPWHSAYSATKFGIRGVSEVLRFDLRRHRIRVSVVYPGAVDTPMVERVTIYGATAPSDHFDQAVGRFRRHAVAAEDAAEKILDGIERNRYLIFTSRDIAVGYWAARHFPSLYALAMRALNGYVTRTLTTPHASATLD